MGAAEAVERVAEGLQALAEVDLDGLCDVEVHELVGELQRLSHRLAAQVCRVSHCWEQRGVWAGDGSKSSAACLAREGRTSQPSARAVLLRGRGLDACPRVAAAFAVGAISTDAVDVLLAARAGREAVFERDEALLVGQAGGLRVAELAKVVRYWRCRADSELGRDGTEPGEAGPALKVFPIDGAVAIEGELDPVGGEIVTKALEQIAGELAGEHPEWARPRLSAAALVEMARRAMATDRRAAPVLVNVVCGHESFAELCELYSGTVIRPGHLVPYAEAIDIRSIVFDTATHAVATSNRRSFAGSLRAVVEVRDRHCQHPSGCDEPIDRCDVDHIVAWSAGGVTAQDNGRLLCHFHNRIEPEHARPPTAADPTAGRLDERHTRTVLGDDRPRAVSAACGLPTAPGR